MCKEKTHRAAGVTAVAIVSYYFLFNASFYWWKAGLTFGPRYAGACIPLLCVGLATASMRMTPVWRRMKIVASACGVFVALMVVSTSSQLSMQDSCPLLHSTWWSFWSGQMALNHESMLTAAEARSGAGAFNLGQLLGLRGLTSLIPLLALWGVAAIAWRRMNLGHPRHI